MKIRTATEHDISTFVELGRTFIDQTRFKAFGYNPERVASNLKAVLEIQTGGHCFLVAESSSGQAIGALIGCIETHFFSEHPVASIIHYDVLPNRRMSGAGLRLLVAFRQWAENRGAVELNAGVNSGAQLDKTDRFLRKLGFRFTGGNYALPLIGTQRDKGAIGLRQSVAKADKAAVSGADFGLNFADEAL